MLSYQAVDAREGVVILLLRKKKKTVAIRDLQFFVSQYQIVLLKACIPKET